MSTIVVMANTQGSVLPNDTPVSSVFGNEMTAQDTPRSLTVLSPELLKTYNVNNLQDLSKTAPSAYMTDQFGGYDVANIRGLDAEAFINGMQALTRTGGPPTSFNSIDSVQLVAGPASSVYGPTENVGGYVNYVTKQPYFDAWHSTTSFTGGMWDEKQWSEDFGAPIIPGELAFRASYEGIYDGSYYENVKEQSQDLYFALTWKPSNDFHVDFNTEFQDTRFDEVSGFNRPTQALISNHEYTSGAYDFGTFSVPNPVLVRISDSSQVVSPHDSDYGKIYNAELAETWDEGNGFSIVNRTLNTYQYLRNDEQAQYYSTLAISDVVEDRLEFHLDFDTPIGSAPAAASPSDSKDMKSMAQTSNFLNFNHSIVTGLFFKSVSLEAYQGYFNEALNVTDLNQPGVYPNANNGSVVAAGYAYPVPGVDMYANPGGYYPNAAGAPGFPFTATGTEAEQAEQASAFFQHDITFTPQWSMLYAGRVDTIFDQISDPLAPTFQPGIVAANDNTVEVEPGANVSVTYKPESWITNYLTFNWSESYPGSPNGGGFNYFTTDNNLSGKSYHLQNFLYEGGTKLDLLDHTLYLTADGYYQTHYAVGAFGGIAQVRVVGTEAQQTYQPDSHFFISLNEAYMLDTVVNPVAEITETSTDLTNGVGSPNFITPGPGDYREGGLPSMMFNGVASYKFDCGLGISANYTITDPIPVSEVDSIWIPWQYELGTSVFYAQKNWEARVNLYNITDQHNWSSGGYIAGSGNDLITLQEPFHWEAKLTYKF